MGAPGQEEERDQPRKDRSRERMGKRKRGERGRGRESSNFSTHLASHLSPLQFSYRSVQS